MKRIILLVLVISTILLLSCNLMGRGSTKEYVPNIISKDNINYKTAFKLYKSGNYANSYKEFKAIIENDSEPTINDYVIYYGARSAFFLGNYSDAISMFDLLESRYPKSILIPYSTQYNALASFYNDNYPINEFFESNTPNWIKKFVGARALDKLVGLKDMDKAYELSLILINNFNSYGAVLFFNKNYKKLAMDSSDEFKSVIANTLYKNNSITSSIDYFESIKSNPKYSEQANYYLARINQRKGDSQNAINMYNQIIANDNYKTYKTYSMFFLAETLNKLKKYDLANKAYSNFVKKYPNDKTYTPQALRRLVVNEGMKGDLKAAKPYLKTILTKFPNSRFADISLRNYVRYAFKLKNKDETYYAIDELKKRYRTFRSDYPLSWQMFAGVEFDDEATRDSAIMSTLLESKNPHHIKGALVYADADILHQVALSNSYYYNEALRLYEAGDNKKAIDSLNNVQFINSIINGEDTPFLTDARKLASNIFIENDFVKDFYSDKSDKDYFSDIMSQTKNDAVKALALYYYEDYDNSYTEYNKLISKTEMTYPVYYYADKIFTKSTNMKRLMQISASVGKYFDYPYSDNVELLPDDFRRLVYPRYFDQYVVSEAKHYKIEPSFVYAIMREESLFDVKAKSFANAYGLMQMIRTTAEMENVLSRYKYKPMDLYNPEQNINLGVAHLSRLFKSENASNYMLIASKYNAGPGNGNKWKREFGTNNMYYTARLVNLEETEYYIERVMKSYDFYSRFYE